MARCIRIWGPVCAHDPQPHYFDRVLLALRDQVTPYNPWELLLIDNTSKPACIALGYFLASKCQSFRENEVGLAAARRAVRGSLAGNSAAPVHFSRKPLRAPGPSSFHEQSKSLNVIRPIGFPTFKMVGLM
jgi:hypothetical protein